jgi:hypothetical protein
MKNENILYAQYVIESLNRSIDYTNYLAESIGSFSNYYDSPKYIRVKKINSILKRINEDVKY